jgi:hypothetical protein
MVLPGAAELVEAFSAIPPGPVRDSVVSHAQVLAQASGWEGPSAFGVPPPPITAHAITSPTPRLTSPFAEGLAATSAEGQIIERALRGEADHVIAADLRVPLGLVVSLKRKARKEGRVIFPGDPGPKPLGRPKKVARTATGKVKAFAMPIPDPPYWWEDPESPIWKNPALLPGLSASAEGTMAALGPHDAKSFRTMEGAASRRGMTLSAYIDLRTSIVRRVDGGESPQQVAFSLNSAQIGSYYVYSLLSKVGRARMATQLEKVAQDGQETAEAAERRATAKTPLAARSGGSAGRSSQEPMSTERRAAIGLAIRKNAAAKWGFSSVEAYEVARTWVRDKRNLGMGTQEIARRLDLPETFVKNTLAYWRDQGVEWPPIKPGGWAGIARVA